MSQPWMQGELASLVLLAAGCASVPRDVGIEEVRTRIAEQGGPRLAWEPAQPIKERLRPLNPADGHGGGGRR